MKIPNLRLRRRYTPQKRGIGSDSLISLSSSHRFQTNPFAASENSIAAPADLLESLSQISSCILAAAVLDLDISLCHFASLPPPIPHNGIDLPLTPTSFQERERKSYLCLSPSSVSVYPLSVSVYLFSLLFPIIV